MKIKTIFFFIPFLLLIIVLLQPIKEGLLDPEDSGRTWDLALKVGGAILQGPMIWLSIL